MTTPRQQTAARVALVGVGVVVLLLSVALLFSCASSDTGPPRSAAEEFMRALFAGDADAVAEVAPTLPGGAGDGSRSAHLQAIFEAVAKFSDWTIGDMSRDGDSAVATVTLTADERTARIIVPLSLEDGEWLVSEQISVTTTLDFVPLESQ